LDIWQRAAFDPISIAANFNRYRLIMLKIRAKDNRNSQKIVIFNGAATADAGWPAPGLILLPLTTTDDPNH
jgi:hypothetical protein